MMKITMRLYPFVTVIAGLMFLASCEEDTTSQDNLDQEKRFFDIYMAANYPDAVPQSSGLFYVENKEGVGEMPIDTSWVLINHVAYKIPANAVYETYIEHVAIDNQMYDEDALYGPYKMRNGVLNEGFTEGLGMMREGGEASFLFTSELGSDAYQSLKYEVILLEVLGTDIEAYEAAKIVAYTDTIMGVDTVYDAVNDLIMYYIVDEASDGPPVAIDSTIQVAYKGYLTDGRVFDEPDDSIYYEFVVGDYDAATAPIDGWHLGLEKFKQGEKGRLIIPYTLAYGSLGSYTSQGNISIPVYETLVFDVEVISVDPDESDDDTDTE